MGASSLFVLLFVGVFAYSTQEKLKVSIFYESLCPDSIRFITQQLHPNYDEVSEDITVDFVPYGKAEHTYIDGQWQFECQHGPLECHGNLMQTCALNQPISQRAKVDFVNCVMSSPNPSNDAYINGCAGLSGVNWTEVLTCSTDGSGAALLAQNGDRTHAVTPTITFIPTIIYNDVYDAELQASSLIDFLGTVRYIIGRNDGENEWKVIIV